MLHFQERETKFFSPSSLFIYLFILSLVKILFVKREESFKEMQWVGEAECVCVRVCVFGSLRREFISLLEQPVRELSPTVP